MVNYIFWAVSIIVIGLFLCCAVLAIYLIILLIYSRGFRISPTVTSNPRSIRLIIKYIKKYLLQTNKDNIKILDIGSGYGTLLFEISRALKNTNDKKVELVGYEISNFAYRISKFRNKYENVTLIKDDINNLNNFDFDLVITFILAKQQKLFLDIYRKFPSGTTIIANSLPIPFEKEDNFQLVETIKVCFRWNIYIYKKIQ